MVSARSSASGRSTASSPMSAGSPEFAAFLLFIDDRSVLQGFAPERPRARSPKANAFAERWVRTVRAEVLDWMRILLGRRHLDRLLDTYVEHYNSHRPHRGLDLTAPPLRLSCTHGQLAPKMSSGETFSVASFTSTTRPPHDGSEFPTSTSSRGASRSVLGSSRTIASPARRERHLRPPIGESSPS